MTPTERRQSWEECRFVFRAMSSPSGLLLAAEHAHWLQEAVDRSLVQSGAVRGEGIRTGTRLSSLEVGEKTQTAQLPHQQQVLCAWPHLTMAFRLAILRVPRARQVVMTAGRPSGMAATARATAILK